MKLAQVLGSGRFDDMPAAVIAHLVSDVNLPGYPAVAATPPAMSANL
jgi:hypothetical protein